MKHLVRYSYHYDSSRIIPSPTEDEVKDAEKWADLFAVLDIPDTFRGEINLTQAETDPFAKAEAGDIMIQFPPEYEY